MELAKLDKSLIISQANKLCEARYKLSIGEQRLIKTLAAQIHPDDEDFKTYRFEIIEFAKLLGINSRSGTLYKHVQEYTDTLLTKTLHFENDNRLLKVNWLSSSEYIKSEGAILLRFDPSLKPLFLLLKGEFTSLKLGHILSFKKTYTVRFYELLKQYEKIGHRTFELMELREILGIDIDQYKLYPDFKRWVIIPAQKELKEKCYFWFEFEEIKKARKVVAIKFTLVFKEDENYQEDTIQMTLKHFGLTEKQIEKVLRQYEESYIIENLKIVEERIKQERVKNIPAFTLKALEQDFRPQRTLFDIKKEEYENKKQEEEKSKLKEKENLRQAEKLRKEFDSYINEKLNYEIAKLTEDELKKLKIEFLYTQDLSMLNNILKYGLDESFNSILFKLFLRYKLLPLKNDFYNYAEEKGFLIDGNQAKLKKELGDKEIEKIRLKIKKNRQEEIEQYEVEQTELAKEKVKEIIKKFINKEDVENEIKVEQIIEVEEKPVKNITKEELEDYKKEFLEENVSNEALFAMINKLGFEHKNVQYHFNNWLESKATTSV